MKLKGPQPDWLSKNPDGTWKVDCKKLFKEIYPGLQNNLELIKDCNKSMNEAVNMDLQKCNRCGLPDDKKNLDKGVIHSRAQCGYPYIHKGRDPLKYFEEFKAIHEKDFYYRENSYLRNNSCLFYTYFEIPHHKGIYVPDFWKKNYHDALRLLE